LQANFEVEVRWRAFPLHPDTPDEGLSLAARYASRNIDPARAMARLQKAAAEAGLPIGERKETFNSRRAQELGKWAEGKGKGHEFHNGVFRAYFVDGQNIARPEILLGLVKALGLPEAEAAEALARRTFREAVDADWALCEQLGITSVPTFVIDRRAVIGAQPYEVLAQFLLDGGVRRK
jgi:predicted DsbA family dithiol-disulfide isomerase